MKRTLFLVLWGIFILGPQAHGDIEIYANGHKYPSMQAYKDSQKAAALSSPAPASLNNQQEDYIRKQAQKLGINVDFNKMKTVQVHPLSAATKHKLYVMGVEDGVVGALRDFYQSRGQSDLQISRSVTFKQLQGAIEQAVTASKGPKLLIAQPGKMRIVALTADDSHQ